ncbi:F-box DNA helicase 1-like isoform X2 [Xenia sp. Carnegie-2017]|uniref:F-box DNA helicase 1-like isoform X2 n=1 Tax=Xenia sp. Carnegie-2017 TaxID=2897299 RepID=UPI001F044152|nr:F-box DNA helicase 1-like isoform X2 [Xenia sp. Carnegie-2017]
MPKLRKRRKDNYFDETQKRIDAFCVRSPDRQYENTNSRKLTCDKIVRATITPKFAQRKKQTILAPFAKIDVMNFGGESIASKREGSQSTFSLNSSSEESELEMIKSCEKAELCMSQENLKNRSKLDQEDAVCRNLFKKNSSHEDIDDAEITCIALNSGEFLSSSDDEESTLDMIDCCEQVELTLSQKKRKIESRSIRKSYHDHSTIEDTESELEIVEHCERVELSLSQEKRKKKRGLVKAMKFSKNLLNDLENCTFTTKTASGCSQMKGGDTMEQISNHKGMSSSVTVVSTKSTQCAENPPKSDSKHRSKKRNCKNEGVEKAKKWKKLIQIDEGDATNLNFMEDLQSTLYAKKSAKNMNKISYSATSSSDMFGLFGVNSSDDDELDKCLSREMLNCFENSYFSDLPDEILENIFCQIPLIDLLTSLTVVCKRWHRIILCETFLVWKKKYYRYKHLYDSRAEFNKLIVEKQLNCAATFPTQLCKFLVSFRISRPEHTQLLAALKLHSKYHIIEKFLQVDVEAFSCWSVVGLLSLVSNTIYDIQEIIFRLLKSSSCFINDILECLHCVALIFFVLSENRQDFFSSRHYRLYYALYLLENSSYCTQSSLASALEANKTGQQSILKYSEKTGRTWLTHEQVRIMNHNTKPEDVLKIVAFAGSGKTTTLVEYTKLRPSWKFLNVAYNKSVQEQALRRFPENVESRTVHSLAFAALGRKYRRKIAPSIRVNTVMNNLSEENANYLHAKRVVDTVSNFVSSSDEIVSCEHVPWHQFTTPASTAKERKQLEYFNSYDYKKKVVADAIDIWEKMTDPTNEDVRITHDGYLKLYQLSKPVIKNYDCILVDEAQDCTPAVSDILLSQRLAKILVGDPHQQIYGFRGATNVMAQVEATQVYYLTQSFRFGAEIASVASSVLDILKGVRSKNIVGIARQGGFGGDHVGQIAVICRTNFHLFNNAVRECMQNSKTRIGFAGGIESYRLDRILDIYKLYTGGASNEIKDKFIKRFRSLDELKKYAQKAPDVELCGKVKIVETHTYKIPDYVARLRQQHCSDLDQAEIVFSTAHKSKGLEFDTVRLGEDFMQQLELFNDLRDAPTDEKNLLYVAITRAKHRLQCSSTLYLFLKEKTDLLVTCESVDYVTEIDSTYCSECRRRCDYSSSFIAIKQAPIVLEFYCSYYNLLHSTYNDDKPALVFIH